MEIQYSKLIVYLKGKNVLPENFGPLLKKLELNINKIINLKDINNLDLEIQEYLLKNKESSKDYLFVSKLLEFLISSSEGKKKTFFGHYKSPLINELIKIKDLYEKNNLDLSELIKETNYLIRFGLTYLDKEQNYTITKIKNMKKKISEIESTQELNVELIKNKLSNFDMLEVFSKFELNKCFLPTNEIYFGIENYFDKQLFFFSERLNDNIKKLLKNDSLINLYKTLVKETNINILDLDDKLDSIIKFPILERIINYENNNINEEDFAIEVIEESSEIEICSIDELQEVNNFNSKDFKNLPPQLFENRELLGSLLMEIFEIKAFTKRVLTETYGIKWETSFDNKDSRDLMLINFYRLTEEITNQLTDISNHEIITYRRDKYLVIENHMEIIRSLFNNINHQENMKNDLRTKIKKYCTKLDELQIKMKETNNKINQNIKELENKLKDILKKDLKIKVSK